MSTSPTQRSIDTSLDDTTFVSGWQRRLVRARMLATLVRVALRAYGDPATALRAARGLVGYAARVGPWPTRLVQHRGRTFGRLARPGFPSAAYDRRLAVELNKYMPTTGRFDLPMALVAITRRCSLRCQHCSEWDTLNQPDTLSIDELRAVVAVLVERGASHIELTGGEPLLRLDAVEAIVRGASERADFWVLTSGAPMTAHNAQRLAAAGVTGVMVSLDHWNPARHDAFRGVAGTFERAVHAMALARAAGLLVGVSITATRETANPADLLRIVGVARAHGASFARVIEPQPAGRWAGADIALGAEHRAAIASLGEACEAAWPIDAPLLDELDAVRRADQCQGAGRRYVFVDAGGDVHACPFCHGAAGSCLHDGLDASLARLRATGCHTDQGEGLVALRVREEARS